MEQGKGEKFKPGLHAFKTPFGGHVRKLPHPYIGVIKPLSSGLAKQHPLM